MSHDINISIQEETLVCNVSEESLSVSIQEQTVNAPIVEQVFSVNGDTEFPVSVVEETYNIVFNEVLNGTSSEDEMPLAVVVDTEGDIIYKGEAVVGSSTASAVWRIRRITISDNGGDLVVQWANGSSSFNQVWDNRASLTYT